MQFSDKQIQIIETAEKLFADKGFNGTSVRDIAEDAGVNVAMISYYFGSKDKLMEAIFEMRLGSIKMRVEALLKDDSISPIQKVNMLIDEHIDRVAQKECFYKIMIAEQVVNKNPAIIKAAREMKVRNAEIIAVMIKDGQKKGVFKKNIDVVLMMNTMVGTVWQTMSGRDYYSQANKYQSLPDDELVTLIKRKLSIHIKTLFKAILTNEA